MALHDSGEVCLTVLLDAVANLSNSYLDMDFMGWTLLVSLLSYTLVPNGQPMLIKACCDAVADAVAVAFAVALLLLLFLFAVAVAAAAVIAVMIYFNACVSLCSKTVHEVYVWI